MSTVSAVRLAELLGQWRRGGRAADRLAATVRALILDGQIPLQSQLPAERGLAAALELSRATVTHAYNRLRAEGYIASQQGSGSWVTIPGGHGAAADAELAAGELDLRIAALPAPAIIEELSAAAAAELPRWLDHHGYDPLGLPPLRAAIAARFTARGLPTSPEQLLVTNGALQPLDIAIRALVAPRRTGFVELGLDKVAPAPMAAGDDRQTITIGSLSKSVWGGLRIGWARAEFTLVRRLAAERAKIDLASPVLEQLLATQVLEHLDGIVTERRETISARRAALMTAFSEHLAQWRYRRPAGGLFLWAQLPDPVSTSLAV